MKWLAILMFLSIQTDAYSQEEPPSLMNKDSVLASYIKSYSKEEQFRITKQFIKSSEDVKEYALIYWQNIVDSIEQDLAESILFRFGSNEINLISLIKLSQLAKQIRSNQNEYTIRSIGCCQEGRIQLSYNRGLEVIQYLVGVCDISKHRFNFFYGQEGGAGNVVEIEKSTKEEAEGTNCGVPLYPRLKKH